MSADDLARGFPAFPASRGRGSFARSWWGRAWVAAMEDTALDQQQLRQGRKYAAAGLVGPITVSPGRIAAVVDGEGDGQYRTEVRLAELTSVEWDRFLDRVASRAGHLAALLDRDMPHDLVEAADDAGVHLLPGIGDLDPHCDCPGWELPCRHAAALSFQVSWLLDADPFVLLLMRGMGEREVLDELQRRNAPRLVRTGAGDEDVPAQEAYAREAVPLPELGSVVPTGPLEVPAAPGIPAKAFTLLAANAVESAKALLTSPRATRLSRTQDAVRLAATFPDSPKPDDSDEFVTKVTAWTWGGRHGLDVYESTWTPPKPWIARARAALSEATDGEGPALAVHRNQVTVEGAGVQLRADRDGQWHPYRHEDGTWWPAGQPETDPAVLFGQLLD